VVLQAENSTRVLGVSPAHLCEYASGRKLIQGSILVPVPSGTGNLFRCRLKATVPKV
jgi:hypothetical protein